MRKTLTAIAVAAAVSVAATADAKTLRWAFQGDAQGVEGTAPGPRENFQCSVCGTINDGTGPNLDQKKHQEERK